MDIPEHLAACYVAGWRPGEFREPRLIPKRPPPSLPSMRPNVERQAQGGSKRATYEVGATYGRLRVVAVRPKGWAGASIYTAACLLCGKHHDYSGSLINLASRRNSPCFECRKGRAWRKGAA